MIVPSKYVPQQDLASVSLFTNTWPFGKKQTWPYKAKTSRCFLSDFFNPLCLLKFYTWKELQDFDLISGILITFEQVYLVLTLSCGPCERYPVTWMSINSCVWLKFSCFSIWLYFVNSLLKSTYSAWLNEQPDTGKRDILLDRWSWYIPQKLGSYLASRGPWWLLHKIYIKPQSIPAPGNTCYLMITVLRGSTSMICKLKAQKIL